MHPAASNGFVLNVYKEVSWTSHDAVARVRRILGERQIGHAGTLDPLASGVLLMGVGRGTKLLPYLTELRKEYRGTFLFGVRTSTGDLGGEQLARGPIPDLNRAQVQEIANGFLGRSMQIPPMVSAVKHEGRRLYELARKGIEVERQPRPVEIFRFEILAVDPPRVDFLLECGRGTYVRTLVEDVAGRIGTLGAVEALSRTRVGRFESSDSCRLISPPCYEAAGLQERAVSLRDALGNLPEIELDRTWIRRVRQGGVPPWSALHLDFDPETPATVRLVSPESELVALGRIELRPGPADRPRQESLSLRLERVF